MIILRKSWGKKKTTNEAKSPKKNDKKPPPLRVLALLRVHKVMEILLQVLLPFFFPPLKREERMT